MNKFIEANKSLMKALEDEGNTDLVISVLDNVLVYLSYLKNQATGYEMSEVSDAINHLEGTIAKISKANIENGDGF